MCWGLNSHDFHIISIYIIGDGQQPNTRGFNIPIIRIPYFPGGMSLSPIFGS